MDSNTKIILVAAVAAGAYLLMRRQAASAAPSAPRTGTTAGPAVPTGYSIAAQNEAAAYAGIGSMLGGIYSKVFGGVAQNSTSEVDRETASLLSRYPPPDDSGAFNLPGLVDPYFYESNLFNLNGGGEFSLSGGA